MSKFDEKFESWFNKLVAVEVKPLNREQLARRLKTSSDVIAERQYSEKFARWSKRRDPEGIAWQYLTTKYHPIVNR